MFRALIFALALALPTAALAAEPMEEAVHGEEATGHDAHHAAGHAPHINWFKWGYDAEAGENPPLFFSLLNFAILLGILYKFAGPKVASALRDRHDSIKDALEEGKRLREEAQQRLAEYGAKIANVDKEMTELMTTIRTQAEAEKARILAQAEKQAAALKQDAEDRIAAEIERSRRILEAEVVNAAVAAAEQIIRDKAGDDDQKRLVDGFLAKVGAPAQKGSTDDSW